MNHQNNFGYTALMYAVKADRINTDLVMTLLNSGANVTLKNRNGKGAIHLTKNHSIKRMLKDSEIDRFGRVVKRKDRPKAKDVGLLLDLGHLKVSAKTEKFNVSIITT